MSTASIAKLTGIYPLIDDDLRWEHDPASQIEAVLAAGVSVLQLRLKRASDGDALRLCRWAVERAHKTEALVIVNDRFDLADLAGADGVHLGQNDLAPEKVPGELRERLLIGLSTHTLAQVRESRGQPIDYLAFGPVFGTCSKSSGYDARGVTALAEAVREAGRPVVAIGGIDAARLPEIRAAGACAAAVISAIAAAPDAAAATRRLRHRFTTSPGS